METFGTWRNKCSLRIRAKWGHCQFEFLSLVERKGVLLRYEEKKKTTDKHPHQTPLFLFWSLSVFLPLSLRCYYHSSLPRCSPPFLRTEKEENGHFYWLIIHQSTRTSWCSSNSNWLILLFPHFESSCLSRLKQKKKLHLAKHQISDRGKFDQAYLLEEERSVSRVKSVEEPLQSILDPWPDSLTTLSRTNCSWRNAVCCSSFSGYLYAHQTRNVLLRQDRESIDFY